MSDAQAQPSTLRARLASEFLGTLALVFAGCGAIVVNGLQAGAGTPVGVSMVFGMVVMAMIYALGEVSGAHINPTVTLGFLAARRLERAFVLPYVASPLAGALAAGLLLRALFPAHETLEATAPAGTALQSFLLEVALTWLLMLVILRVSSGSRETGLIAGAAIGSVVALEALFAGPLSGASMNPARSLGPAVASGAWSDLALCLTAPGVGALLAVPTCRLMGAGGCCPPAAVPGSEPCP